MNPPPLFHYKPRTGSSCGAWMALAVPLCIGIAVIQTRHEMNLGVGLVLVALSVFVGLGLFAFLLFLVRFSQRKNSIFVHSDGRLIGRFGLGGFRLQASLPEVQRLEIIRQRRMTRIWIVPRTGGRRKLLMAFYDQWDEETLTSFTQAVESFGVQLDRGSS